MRSAAYGRSISILVNLLGAGFVALAAASAWSSDYNASGTFVEGCSCTVPCTCAMTSPRHGCQGVGAMVFSSGSYKDTDLAGAKLAYATAPGGWIRFYLDTKNAKQHEALAELATALYKKFGKIEAMKNAGIGLVGKQGHYILTVDGGKIIHLTIEPVLGADKKAPMSHENTFEPLSPSVMQGRTLKAGYQDGDRAFTLEGSNAFFNASAHSSGAL